MDWVRLRRYLYQCDEKLTLGQVQSVLEYIAEIFPGDHDLQVSILQTSPRILKKSVKTFLRPTVDFLKNLYGPDLFREAIRRNTGLLLMQGVGFNAGFSDTTSSYLQDQMGLSAATVEALQRKEPKLFQRPLSQIVSVVSFLEEVLEHGKHNSAKIRKLVAKIIVRHPTLLHLSVDNKLRPQLEFVTQYCRMEPTDVAAAITSVSGAAFILTLSIEDNLKPTLQYLAQIVSADAGDLKRCLVKSPDLLGLSVANLQGKVEYLDRIDPPIQSENGRRVASQGLAARIMIRAPTVYSLSLTDNIVPKVDFLAGVWGTSAPSPEKDRSESDVHKDLSMLSLLLGQTPTLLTLSLEGNIQPTLTFYNRTGYIHLDGNWKLQPGKNAARTIRGRELCVSLFKRLLPRWHFVSSKRRNGSSPAPTPLIPLDILVAATDKAFCEVYEVPEDEYEAFKIDAVPQLKFSSQFNTWLKTGRPIELDG